MSETITIRAATPDDGDAIAAIYAPYVRDTAISFEETPPGGAEMARRIETAITRYPYLVAEDGDRIVAYAYAGPYRARHAYRFTAEVSAYAAPAAQGKGIAAELYRRILSDLTETGFHTAVAIITLPNEKSETFHKRLGFAHIGTLARVGRKFDAWHDTGIWQRHLNGDAAHG